MSARQLGFLLLFVGFLAGAYTVVAQVDTVHWVHYSGCAGLMVAGLVVVRAAQGQAALVSETHDENLDVLEAALDRLIGKVGAYKAIESEEELTRVHERIDAELMDDLDAFVQARESMIPSLGMQHYADVMSAFALGERLLNRSWSASADGYVDEVRACVAQAYEQLEQASALLREARASD